MPASALLLAVGPQVTVWLPATLGVWFAWLAVVAVGWLWFHPEDRRAALTVVGLGVVWTLVASRLGPSVPVGWLNPLREGFSLDTLDHLAGAFQDAGPVPPLGWRPWFGPGPADLRQAVTDNLVVGGWSVLVFALLASRLVRDRLLVTAVVVGFASGPLWRVSLMGPLNAPYVVWHTIVGATLLAMARDRAWPLPLRLATLGALLLDGVLLVGCREELAVLAGAGLLATVTVLRPDLEPRLAARWIDPLADRLRGAWWGLLLLAVAWVAAAWAYGPGPMPDLRGFNAARWVLGGLHPTNVHGLGLPLVLVALVAPGLAALTLRGALAGLARPLTWALLPVVLWVLYGTWRMAAHGQIAMVSRVSPSPFELYRYLLAAQGLLWLLALAGARAWSDLPGRARGALLAACLLPPLPEAACLLPMERDTCPVWPRWGGFHRDSQAEHRFVQQRLDEAPACAVLGLGHRWGGRPSAERFGWAALLPAGDAWRLVNGDLPADTPVTEVADALLGDVPCAVAWRSLDCDEVHGPGCAPLDGLDVLREVALPRRPFVHPEHGGDWQGPARLELLAIPGRPTELPAAP